MHSNVYDKFENYVTNNEWGRKRKSNDLKSTSVLKQQKLNLFQSHQINVSKQKEFEVT